MDSNYRRDLLKCIELMKEHILSGDSFILSKTKAMRTMFLNQDDAKILSGMTEYQEMKKKYLNQHRTDKSWTNKLTNS